MTTNLGFQDETLAAAGDVVVNVTNQRRFLNSNHKKSAWISNANRRQQALTVLQTICRQRIEGQQGSAGLTADEFCQLFSTTGVLKTLFLLLDHQAEDILTQAVLIDFLKGKLGECEFIDLLDTLSYVIAGDHVDLDFELFSQVFLSRGVLRKLFHLINKDVSDIASLEEIMNFFTELTLHRRDDDLSVHLELAEKYFRAMIKEGAHELSLEDFKKMIPCKNPFFAERAFRVFDKDGSNSISIFEFREGLEQFCGPSIEDKVRFLFQIYDQDGDGFIKLHELKAVMKACTEENGMKFSEEQLDQLTLALYEDAALTKDSSSDWGSITKIDTGIHYEQLKAQLDKHPGLLDNLSISLERFLLPTANQSKIQRPPSSPFPSKLCCTSHLRNTIPYTCFIAAYVIVHIILTTKRIYDYWTYPTLYIMARIGAQALNFNCSLVAVLMLRHCITWLRMQGLGSYLPLDNHVYLHKMVGAVIVFFGSLHTLMHILNFNLNVANNWISEGTNQTHSAFEWLFTPVPRHFGLVPGWATITGWVLVAILAVMGVCSLPFVRKRGNFEVFYYTHLLYVPFWILLVLHGTYFCYWFVVPGILFVVVEVGGKIRLRWAGKGKTFVSSAVLLPSKVTHLVIRKPAGFHFHPGDYVYVKIPTIASFEWHPFTISSAPELPDSIWLHVRAVGGWTNKLYDHFEKEQAKMCIRETQTSMANSQSPECQHCSNILDTPSKGRKKSVRKSLVSPMPSCRLRLQSNTSSAGDGQEVRYSSALSESSLTLMSRQASETASIKSSATLGGGDGNAYRYMRHRPGVISIPVPMEKLASNNNLRKLALSQSVLTPRSMYAPNPLNDDDPVEVHVAITSNNINKNWDKYKLDNETINQNSSSPRISEPLEIVIDGPYGAPSSHIFRAEHAVLIAAGIGVTPFASILQSIMNRYYGSRQTCPECNHSWATKMPDSVMNLRKVDFFWLNREQRSFEWFVGLLSQLEMQQAENGGVFERFLDLHMYITSALQKTDMKALGLQMALDLLHDKEKRDLVTGLKTRTIAGRPNWDKVFQKLVDQNKGRVTVFYCGPPQLAKDLSKKCDDFGFTFRKEIF